MIFKLTPGRLASLWPSLIAVCLLFFANCAKPLTENVSSPEAAMQLLKLRGYEFDEKGFFDAVGARDALAVNAFLVARIDPNARNPRDGRTALISSAARGDLAIVDVLLRGGADVNAKDASGFTALFNALEARYDEVADLLVAQPSLDLNARGKNDVTALIAYVWRDRPDAVKKLLDRGAAVDLRDADGDTALHGAAENGNREIIMMLLARGADANAKNKVGGTPLMWAAVYGNEEAVALLLDHGADPSLKDEGGVTALAWAERNKRGKVVEILRRHL